MATASTVGDSVAAYSSCNSESSKELTVGLKMLR
jgi:hypothetical protein